MFIAKTIFPKKLAYDMIDYLGKNKDVRILNCLIDENRALINQFHEYYKKLFKKSIYEIFAQLEINCNWPDSIPRFN